MSETLSQPPTEIASQIAPVNPAEIPALEQGIGADASNLQESFNTVEHDVVKSVKRYLMVGRFLLAASKLNGTEPGDMPDLKYWRIDGSREEMREHADSKEYVEAFYEEGIAVAELLQKTGNTQGMSELLQDLLFQVAEDGGMFATSLEKGYLSESQQFRLLRLATIDKNYEGTNFKYLTRQRPYEFRVPADASNEVVSTSAMIELAKNDSDRLRGMQVMSMYAKNLASGISGQQKGNESVQNEALLLNILEGFGFDQKQANEVFEALSQSSKEDTHYVLMNERVASALNLLTEIRERSSDEESYKNAVQSLYKNFGIRNFHRYTPDGILPQLNPNFKPEEVIITATHDYGSALSNPENSARGMQYDNPAFFEASDSLGIAKSLITANKMSGKPLDKILIRAHGASDGFRLSKGSKGDVNTNYIVSLGSVDGWDKQMIERGVVDKNAELVFESCSLGAGGFPKSLFERTGIVPLTSPKNIVGSALEGSPGVIRTADGKVLFGTSAPSIDGGGRDAESLSEPVSIK